MSQEGSFQAPKKGIPWAWVIAGLVVLVISAGFAIKAIEGTFTYYVTADEYMSHREDFIGKRLKIAGTVQEGSLVTKEGEYEFIVELQGYSFPVKYKGFAPDTFKEKVEVVVEGRATEDEVFIAETLMAKCASKYEVGGLPPLEQRK